MSLALLTALQLILRKMCCCLCTLCSCSPLAADAWLCRAGFEAHTFRWHTFASQWTGLSSLSVAAIAHGSFSKDLTNRLEPAKEFCVFVTLRRLSFHCLHPRFEPVFRFSRRGMRDADFGWFVAEAFAKQLHGSRIGGNTVTKYTTRPFVVFVYFAMWYFRSTRYKFAELEELAACIHDQEGFFMLGRRIILIER